MADSTTVKAAQLTASLSAAFASGGIISLSLLTLPTLVLPARNSKQQQPGTPASQLSHQFLYLYDKGKVLFPSIAITSTLLHSYVAYAVRHHKARNGMSLSVLYLTAATLVMMIAPFTGLVIAPVNKKLAAHAQRDDGGEQQGDKGGPKSPLDAEEQARRKRQDDELPSLLATWSRMNMVRGVFPLVGAALGAAVSFGLL